MDERVRRILIDTLYSHPASLTLAAACGVLTSAVAAWQAQMPIITAAAILLSTIAVLRVVMAFMLRRFVDRVRMLEIAYEVGAFAYASLVGLIAAMTVVLDVDQYVTLLMVANGIGYAVAIAARNANAFPDPENLAIHTI